MKNSFYVEHCSQMEYSSYLEYCSQIEHSSCLEHCSPQKKLLPHGKLLLLRTLLSNEHSSYLEHCFSHRTLLPNGLLSHPWTKNWHQLIVLKSLCTWGELYYLHYNYYTKQICSYTYIRDVSYLEWSENHIEPLGNKSGHQPVPLPILEYFSSN